MGHLWPDCPCLAWQAGLASSLYKAAKQPPWSPFLQLNFNHSYKQQITRVHIFNIVNWKEKLTLKEAQVEVSIYFKAVLWQIKLPIIFFYKYKEKNEDKMTSNIIPISATGRTDKSTNQILRHIIAHRLTDHPLPILNSILASFHNETKWLLNFFFWPWVPWTYRHLFNYIVYIFYYLHS